MSDSSAQMRHYIIHFWQQLPNHVLIDLEALKALDLNLYSTLEDIYLRLDAGLDQLKHLQAIATLNPLWLKKALESYGNEEVRRLKVEESIKWKYRIKSQIQLINISKVSAICLTDSHNCQLIRVFTLRSSDVRLESNEELRQCIAFSRLQSTVSHKRIDFELIFASIGSH